MEIGKLVFYFLTGSAGTILGGIFLNIRLKEIKEIKIGKNDGDIKAVVVDWHVLYTTGDIRPILLYKVDGEEKKYEYHFYHTEKEYPIGKEVNLKLSKASGLAYDKKDLIQGVLCMLSATLFTAVGLLVGIIYVLLFR